MHFVHFIKWCGSEFIEAVSGLVNCILIRLKIKDKIIQKPGWRF